ncbi:TniB family NTP-binding protein [Rubrimonas sp.]|uniref:TniB family NTP-binding protein n=1 Tax=Rubrimonas sp. TaxID=2036015 RepID=UPI002FDE29A3
MNQSSHTIDAAPSASPSAVVQRLRRRYVATDDDPELRRHLGRILIARDDGALTLDPIRHGDEGDTRGVMVMAPPGAGKTRLVGTALDDLLKASGATVGEGRHPILRVTVPAPATLKSLGLELLAATGYGAMGVRQERWHIWSTVRHRLGVVGARVLWLDEAQHLMGRATEVTQALDTLKTLMQGPNAVAVILSGVPALARVFTIDEQVGRRFSHMTLTEGRSPKVARGVGMMIARFAEEAGLGAPTERDLAARLLHGVDGRFGLCMETVVDAIAQALSVKAGTLERQHFAEAWGLGRGCAPGDNVFLVDAWAGTPPLGVPPAPVEEETATKRRGRGRR